MATPGLPMGDAAGEGGKRPASTRMAMGNTAMGRGFWAAGPAILQGLGILLVLGCAKPHPILPAKPPQAAEQLSPVATAGHPGLDEMLQECRRAGELAGVSCHYQLFEERPTLMVGFADLASAAESELATSDELAHRFCPSSRKDALIVVTLANGEIARLYSCEVRQWGNWFEIAHPLL